MGYYTRHTLSIEVPKDTDEKLDEEQIIAELRSGNEEAAYSLNESGGTEEESKWYNSESDMKKFSTKYPECLFILEGAGEESGDFWKSYIKNGKCQRGHGKVVFDDYDPTKLV